MAANIKEQLADLHKQILELQYQLPDSPFHLELQRLQRDLENYRKNPPIPRPQITMVQPVPPHLVLNPNELAVWNTFLDYHKALLQEAGGGYYLPRQEWLRLVDVAADLTTAIYASGGYPIVPVFAPPTSPGIYGWDGATQGWLPTVNAPTQTSGILAYDASTGLWVPTPSVMGNTDGSTPPVGQIGEYAESKQSFSISTRYNESAWDQVPLNPVGTLNLSAGDWQVGALMTMETIGEPTTYVAATFSGPNGSYPWFIRGVTSQDLSPHFTAMRCTWASPFSVQLALEIVTTGAPQLVQVPVFSWIWARRAS